MWQVTECGVLLFRRRLRLRFDCDSIRLPFDCSSTALRPFDEPTSRPGRCDSDADQTSAERRPHEPLHTTLFLRQHDVAVAKSPEAVVTNTPRLWFEAVRRLFDGIRRRIAVERQWSRSGMLQNQRFNHRHLAAIPGRAKKYPLNFLLIFLTTTETCYIKF